MNDYRGYRPNNVRYYDQRNCDQKNLIIQKKRNVGKKALAGFGALTLFGGVTALISNLVNKSNAATNTVYPTIRADQIIPTATPTVNNDEYILPAVEENIPVATEVITPVPTEVPTPVPTEVPVINNFNRGDSVVTISSVNMRLNPNLNGFKIGEVPRNSTIDRIASVGNWDLIRYGGQIAYVSSDYTADSVDYNNEYYTVEECSDVVRTTSSVYFRLGPSKSESDICLLSKNEELEVIGKSVNFNDPSDVWYLAKYKGQIGFICAKYTVSLRDIIKGMDPNITELQVEKVGYLRYDSYLYNFDGSTAGYAEAYQAVKVLDDRGDSYLAEVNSTVGLVSKDAVHTYSGVFVIVDLSEQKIYLYCDTDQVFESYCTTGKNSTPTNVGAFSVYERTPTRYFSEDAQAQEMWANFDHGNGIHDAPWEPEKYFGSESYRKNHGSAGCVRLPDWAAQFLKKYIAMGTKVLVKR